MKALRFALALFAALVMLNVYFYIFLGSATDELSRSLDEVIEILSQTGEPSACKEKLFALNADYSEKRKIMALAVNHEELLAVDEALQNSLGYADSDNEDNLSGSLRVARLRVVTIFERERLTLGNIF